MDRSMKRKFNLKFVKPLYKRTRINDSSVIVNRTFPGGFDRSIKLYGDDFNVRTVVKSGVNEIGAKRNIGKEYKVLLPGTCETNDENVHNLKSIENTLSNEYNGPKSDFKMLTTSNAKTTENNKLSQENSRKIIYHKAPETWLRVYPTTKKENESFYSILLRCIFCQLGLMTFLILWTIIAVFVIQSYEGPHEINVSLEFEKEQNQVVIDLATELRQITPLSPKWRYAIERRIEDERQLTMRALDDGAKLKPGQFWDLPGTFLFSVYVMTALGFGAPVPHTILGRTSALIYAFLAIPTHIFLMMNASMCLVIHTEECMKSLSENFCGELDKQQNLEERENASYSRNTGPKKSSDSWSFRNNVKCCLNIVCAGRCVPFASLAYYAVGAVSFGVLRNKSPLEIIMFPLEFTTTGGLERVEGYVRILYGIYVEGAMCLLACILATFRRHGTSLLSCISENYRLFDSLNCEECENDIDK